MSSEDSKVTPTPRMPWVTGTTRFFGTIAHPADHVRAPMVFNPIFAERGLDHVMVPIDAPPEALARVVAALRAIPNFGGMAVTIPHKMEIAELCDTLGPEARLTGAVNAVRFDADGSMHGDNFDGAGFVAGLRHNGNDPSGKDVLMVGAGGAARAIALALCEAGVGRLRISNRTPRKADDIVAALADLAGHRQAETAVGHNGAGVDMIVNTTSLGLHDGDALPIALDAVDPNTLIAEIIMVPERTDWLADAEARGLATHYGRHMLDYQVDLIGGFIGAL
ncbi:MAG: shikimate dehydrogenase [Pseudomonadota bacterium]|nr:shikimate dehydrogenase [Pseudomonadota bacterium]